MKLDLETNNESKKCFIRLIFTRHARNAYSTLATKAGLKDPATGVIHHDNQTKAALLNEFFSSLCTQLTYGNLYSAILTDVVGCWASLYAVIQVDMVGTHRISKALGLTFTSSALGFLIAAPLSGRVTTFLELEVRISKFFFPFTE
jgi:hypothetical protein